jgi:hypothetical protein
MRRFESTAGGFNPHGMTNNGAKLPGKRRGDSHIGRPSKLTPHQQREVLNDARAVS